MGGGEEEVLVKEGEGEVLGEKDDSINGGEEDVCNNRDTDKLRYL